MEIRVGDHVSDSRSSFHGKVIRNGRKFTTFLAGGYGIVRIKTRDLDRNAPKGSATVPMRPVK